MAFLACPTEERIPKDSFGHLLSFLEQEKNFLKNVRESLEVVLIKMSDHRFSLPEADQISESLFQG